MGKSIRPRSGHAFAHAVFMSFAGSGWAARNILPILLFFYLKKYVVITIDF